MTKLATSGTASCAIISLSWFKPKDRERNKAYLSLTKDEKEIEMREIRAEIEQWYDDVLWPVSQELGESDHLPFDGIMDVIDSNPSNKGSEEEPNWHYLKGKLILAALNEQQKNAGDGYWVERLTARGFSLIDITKNNIGQKVYVYSRNLNRRDK